MVGTILPVVYGQRASGRRPTSHWLHLASSVAGAALLGLAVGAVGGLFRLDPAIAITGTLAIAAAYLATALGLVSVPAPQRRQQVPKAWVTKYSPHAMSAGFGMALGAGVFTHIWVYTFYPILAWIALAGGPWTGLLVWAAFGFGRAWPVVMLGARTHDVREAFEASRRLEAFAPLVGIVDGLLLALIAGYMLGGLLP
jgi:cytochrome c biogenesis protein CcdA